MKGNLISAVILTILFLTSCSGGKIFEEHTDIKGNVWNRFEVIEFETDIRDIGNSYDFFITIRHMEQFPLKFITIDFTFYTPSGETRSSEHRIDIKDADGNLLGKGMGDLWDLEKAVWKGYTFSEPGICRFEISSTMSYADLPGIMQVGLIVRKAR